jgi:dipeptidyl aminopeptidase/acylaminoacyl peptidase
MPLPIYSGWFVTASPFSRTVAGDTPGHLQLYVVESAGDNPPRLLDAGSGLEFRRARWSHDSKWLVVVIESPNYKSEGIRIVDINTGKSKVVFHEDDDRWIEFSETGWDPASKQIWFTSDRTGFSHLYTVSLDGSGLKQITNGNWEIHSDPFSSNPQWIGPYIYYSSTPAGTAERQFYRVRADGSAPPERLSEREGLNIGWVSEDGEARATMEAELKNPFDLYVNGTRVTRSPLPDFYKMQWAESRFVSSLADRKPVAARLLLPSGYDPADGQQKLRPAIIYSGVYDWANYNVLFQDAVQLSEKLIDEGKPFEEAFYPEESHAYIREESLKDAFGRTARFFDRYLAAP